MIKKIKVLSVWVNEEKEITSKKDQKKYKLVETNVKVADDSKELAGEYIRVTKFAYLNPKDPSKSRSATVEAEYFKTQSEGKEILLEVTEQTYVKKDGTDGRSYQGKTLSKKEKEMYEKMAAQFAKQ